MEGKTNTSNPKVSVIVPIYNVEQYLSKCLESIVNQSMKEIEIICVNDGSKDNSLKILEKFAEKDSRIIVINKENGGVSSARNVGLKIAKGDYIAFLDSDDWVDTEFYEKLYNASVNNDADISVATIIRKREYSQKYRVHYTEEKIYTELKEKLEACKIPKCCYVWNKLYKSSLIKNNYFVEGKYFEDILWIPEVIKASEKLVTVPVINYYYRVNQCSIVKKNSPKKQTDSYNAKKYLTEFYNKNGLEFSKKSQIITKEIKYFMNLPIFKIKECRNEEIGVLFGFLPIFKRKITKKLVFKHPKKMFLLKNLDSHTYINIFGIQISCKNKNGFDYKKAIEYGLTREERKTKLIVSLASFPGRISCVHRTINTLLRQTLKPDKVILWLATSQFPNKEKDLPQELLLLLDLGLEIGWCDEDLRSYKKLVPALKKYPEDIIITADDDLYYNEDWLESLYNTYLKNPNCVCTRRACMLKMSGNVVKIFPHYDNKHYEPTFGNQLMGGAGTLYPPHVLHDDIFDVEKIKTLIPTFDDIYFWAMAVNNGVKIALVNNKDVNLYVVENSQDVALCKINGQVNNMNDKEAFTRIFEEYPMVKERIG